MPLLVGPPVRKAGAKQFHRLNLPGPPLVHQPQAGVLKSGCREENAQVVDWELIWSTILGNLKIDGFLQKSRMVKISCEFLHVTSVEAGVEQ